MTETTSNCFGQGFFYVNISATIKKRQKPQTCESLISASPQNKDGCGYGILTEILAVTSTSLNNAMLTIKIQIDKPINQEIYDCIKSTLDLSILPCPCGTIGEFIWYGRYKRRVALSGGGYITLWVARIRCKRCGHTHAILLCTIVPYSKYPLPVQADIIESHEKGASFNSILENHPSIELDTIKSILRKYQRHWRERFLSIGIALYPLERLIWESFKHFKLQFMQIKSTPNKFVPLPT